MPHFDVHEMVVFSRYFAVFSCLLLFLVYISFQFKSFLLISFFFTVFGLPSLRHHTKYHISRAELICGVLE